MKTGPKGRVAHACLTEAHCVHLFTSGHRLSRTSFMHASMPFDAKCSTEEVVHFRNASADWYHRTLDRRSSQVVLFLFVHGLPRGDTVVLSLYLGLELLKYRILPGRDRFLRVNDTKIVCRPRGPRCLRARFVRQVSLPLRAFAGQSFPL